MMGDVFVRDWINEFANMLFCLEISALNIEGAYSLKYANLPRSIFKYRRVDDFALNNLRDNTVWMADPQSFNDPYDCGQSIDFEAMSALLFSHSDNAVLAELSEDSRQTVSKGIKVMKMKHENHAFAMQAVEVFDADRRILPDSMI